MNLFYKLKVTHSCWQRKVEYNIVMDFSATNVQLNIAVFYPVCPVTK